MQIRNVQPAQILFQQATSTSEKMDKEKLLEISADMYRYATNNDDRMFEKINAYFDEGIKNPSLAMLISVHTSMENVRINGDKLNDDIAFLRGEPKELIKKYLKDTVMCYKRIKDALKEPTISAKNIFFDIKLKDLYPKTHKLRKKLINEQRVCYSESKLCLPTSFKKTLKYARFF